MNDFEKRAIRNHERRQGKSVLPLHVSRPHADPVIRVFDPETGGWSEWSHFGFGTTAGAKMRFYDEHDPNA